MTEVLTEFIRALRAADVRISTSELIDAGAVLRLVGYDSRDVLLHSLSQVLARTEDEKQAFTATFDRFFAFEQFTDKPDAPETPDDDAARPSNAAAQPAGAGGMPGGGAGEWAASRRILLRFSSRATRRACRWSSPRRRARSESTRSAFSLNAASTPAE